jgi:hypothetical protein
VGRGPTARALGGGGGGGGGGGRGGGGGAGGAPGARPRERSEEGRGPRKRPRSPSFDGSGSSGRPERAYPPGRDTDRGRGDERGGRLGGGYPPEPEHRNGGRGGEGQWGGPAGEPTFSARNGGAGRERPSREEVEELDKVQQHFCNSGDHCPSLRDRGPCTYLHSVDIVRRLTHLSHWVRETALTLLRSHPFAEMATEEYEAQDRGFQESTWKKGVQRVVGGWQREPRAMDTEAPPVPAPHFDADPSGAPRGVQRRELADLRDLVPRFCFRGRNCHFRVCQGMHAEGLARARVGAWAEREAGRLMGTHPYDHLSPEDYKSWRSEAVERLWRAGLARQADKWMEWHDAASRPAHDEYPEARQGAPRWEGRGRGADHGGVPPHGPDGYAHHDSYRGHHRGPSAPARSWSRSRSHPRR